MGTTHSTLGATEGAQQDPKTTGAFYGAEVLQVVSATPPGSANTQDFVLENLNSDTFSDLYRSSTNYSKEGLVTQNQCENKAANTTANNIGEGLKPALSDDKLSFTF